LICFKLAELEKLDDNKEELPLELFIIELVAAFAIAVLLSDAAETCCCCWDELIVFKNADLFVPLRKL
jgi:hypothetical protein